MRVYQITVEDLTHLGGPMGTEYTTTLGTYLAGSEGGLLKLWEKLILKYRIKNAPHGPEIGATHDFGHVGFRITSEEVEK